MIKRVIAVASFSAGYVLGAHAGRERYEQIRRVALRVKDDPHLHDLMGEVTVPLIPGAPSAAEPSAVPR